MTLLEGPALAAGLLIALLLPGPPARLRAAGALAVAGSAAVGAYDDLAGDGGDRGLRGHLAALRRGRVTTGTVKVLGLALTGVTSVWIAGAKATGRRPAGSPVTSGGVDPLVGGAVVAASANLVNLLDLRPGRALKTVLLWAALTRGAGEPLAAAAAGAAVGLIGDDLAERTMLGDGGANAVGALVGLAAVVGGGRRRRWLALGALSALTLASERVSFTRVIEGTPGLRELDRLGRRPPPSTS